MHVKAVLAWLVDQACERIAYWGEHDEYRGQVYEMQSKIPCAGRSRRKVGQVPQVPSTD